MDRTMIGIAMFIVAVLIMLDITSSGTGTGIPAYARVPLAVAIGCGGLVIAFPSILGDSDTADRVKSVGSAIGLIFVVLIIAASLSNFFS